MLAISSDLPVLWPEAVGSRLCFPKVEPPLTGGQAPRCVATRSCYNEAPVRQRTVKGR